MAIERICVDSQIMGGEPCIRGTRIPVATVAGLAVEGWSDAQIVPDRPQLDLDDVRAAPGTTPEARTRQETAARSREIIRTQRDTQERRG